MQDFTDKLRPLVGLNGWDYCVLWKLSPDQRVIELVECCCGGSENINSNEEGVLNSTCRDVSFHHLTTHSCHLLSLLPSPMSLDSGVQAQALLSNQPRWLNFSNSSDSCLLDETVGTKVLVPVPGGLVELFVAKQVPEDQQLMHCISVQYNISCIEQQQQQLNNMDQSFSVNVNDYHHQNDQKDPFNPPSLENLNYDISSTKRIRLCNSPMNFFQQFGYTSQDLSLADKLVDPFKSSMENGLQDMDELHKPMMSHNGSINGHIAEAMIEKEQQGNHKDSVKLETGRSESISDCSDPNDDEDDPRYRRRTGKGSQAKNLHAERRRRKKLNDRLYALRALVPNISKLDRASILGDAIEFVKELQKQEKDLQQELEEQSDDEEGTNKNNENPNNGCSELLKHENNNDNKAPTWFHIKPPPNGVTDSTRQNHDTKFANDKVPQMEPQVEVAQLDENKFFVKVFCEHKAGGFVRLMEALNSLGLEVTNVNVTSCTSLVSNVFNVVKRDSEMVQADHVRDSLLEITRNPSGGWPEIIKAPSENINGGMDCHHQHHRNQNNTSIHQHHNHHLHN